MASLRCEACLNEYPIETYPDLIKGVVCKTCLDGTKMEKTQRILKEKAQSMANALAGMDEQQVSGQLGSVSQILAEVYTNFGGPSGFASQLHQVLVELCNRKPMPTAVGHILINIMKLHHTVERSSQELSIKEMTLDQLKREQDMATLQLIAESMSDPVKMRQLELLFARFGKSIKEAGASEIIDVVSHRAETLPEPTLPMVSTVANLGMKQPETLSESESAMPTEEEIKAFLDGTL
jgi:hypothetical protein